MSDRSRTGGTIVGVAVDEGVAVVASREAGGGSTRTGTTRRLRGVHPQGAAGGVGPVGDVGSLLRALRSAVDLYEERRGAPPPVHAMATMAADRLREGSGGPLTLVVAGLDDDGGHLFEIDAEGGVTEDDRIAVGAGREVAAGVLEAAGVAADLDAAVSVAADGLSAAIERIGGTGEGVTVVRIDADGVAVEDVDSLDELA